MVNATSTEALPSLLDAALEAGQSELAVRIGYWREEEDPALVESVVAQTREKHGLTESPAWTVTYYPASGPVGLIEFVWGSGDAEK